MQRLTRNILLCLTIYVRAMDNSSECPEIHPYKVRLLLEMHNRTNLSSEDQRIFLERLMHYNPQSLFLQETDILPKQPPSKIVARFEAMVEPSSNQSQRKRRRDD